jgi:MraZ protein
MFIGEYRHTTDAKRRLSIPAKFRTEIGKSAVLAKGLDRSLILYPMEEWKVIAEKLAALPMGKAGMRGFVRSRFADAAVVELDGLGRILIPENLAEFAGLSKNVVIAGLYTRLEIWDETAWQAYKKDTEARADDVAEDLGEKGIY